MIPFGSVIFAHYIRNWFAVSYHARDLANNGIGPDLTLAVIALVTSEIDFHFPKTYVYILAKLMWGNFYRHIIGRISVETNARSVKTGNFRDYPAD
jgi:hypothetical protein